MDIRKAILDNGIYTAETGISVVEWKAILLDARLFKDEYKQVLNQFLKEPEHASTCEAIANKYQSTSILVSEMITGFGKAVQDKLQRFRVIGTNNSAAFWLVPMFGKKYNEGFKWVVRPELVEAISAVEAGQIDDVNPAVLEQKNSVVPVEKKSNTPVGVNKAKEKSMAIRGIFVAREEEAEPKVLESVETEAEMEVLRNKIKQDLIAEISGEVGEEVRNEMKVGFEALKRLVDDMDRERFAQDIEDKEEPSVAPVNSEESSNLNSKVAVPLVPEATVGSVGPDASVEQQSERLQAPLIALPKKSLDVPDVQNGNLLQEMYSCALDDVNWIFYQWFPNYKKQVNHYKQLINAGGVGLRSKEIANLISGVAINKNTNQPLVYLNQAELSRIMDNMDSISDLIHEIVGKSFIRPEQYQALHQFFNSQVGTRLPNLSNGVLSGLLPGTVTTMVDQYHFKKVVTELKSRVSDFPDLTDNWLTDNINFVNYCKKQVAFQEPGHASLFIWYLKECFEKEVLDKGIAQHEKFRKDCVNMLLLHKNLIIQGVTGSGKTKIAKNIAKDLNAEVAFVPAGSIGDYDDPKLGVEGKNSGVVTKLNDGVFISFCRKAALNLLENKEKPYRFQSVYAKNLKPFFERFSIRKNSGFSVESNKSEQLEPTCRDKKSFVFILDGISGFDATDVFQEAIHSIAAHLRGEPGKLRMNGHQELLAGQDPFADGFYIPENVYIIMTVDSLKAVSQPLDFDSSKDFIWKSISVDDGISLLDDIHEDYKLEAIRRLKLVNEVIDGRVELGEAYRIGAAYFLKIEKYEGDFEAMWDSYLKEVLRRHLGSVSKRDEIVAEIEAVYKHPNKYFVLRGDAQRKKYFSA